MLIALVQSLSFFSWHVPIVSQLIIANEPAERRGSAGEAAENRPFRYSAGNWGEFQILTNR